MIQLKNSIQLEQMREACIISAEALKIGGHAVQPGITTKQIDKIIHDYIHSKNAKPSFLGYGGFPASACISVNEQVIHGIPDDRVILEGDIVSIDVGAYYKGFHGDNAATFPAGKISDKAQHLLDITKESLYKGIEKFQIGNRIGDISFEIQNHCEKAGFGVVRKFVGHGVGKSLHESPEVPNIGKPGRGIRLCAGMTLAIEPMINAGMQDVKILDDGWCVVTLDNSLSAHFEHTVALIDNGPVILTQL